MKKGIPCFDYSETGLKACRRIDFNFVSGDEEIASSCTVSVGDTDPLTGEVIADLTFIREYHRLRNREIYLNKKEASVPLTAAKARERREIREGIRAEFVREYGYEPDKGTLDWLVNEKLPKQYRLQMDSLVNEDGESRLDSMAEFADPAGEAGFRAVEESGCRTLEDFRETLTEKQKVVFDLLRREADGENLRGGSRELAGEWGVSKQMVSAMRRTIGKKLMKWMQEEE